MIKNCLDFTNKISVVRRLIYASSVLPAETPNLWDIVCSFGKGSAETATDLTPTKAKIFIENLRYIEPEAVVADENLTKEIRSVAGIDKVPLGVILLSPNTVCLQCGSSLLVKADRPSTITVYTDTEGTIKGTHYRKLCKQFRSGCPFVQHYGYYSVGGSSVIYNDNWDKLKYFLSTRETAIELSLLKQYDIELLIGQLSYKQRAEIYNMKHGYFQVKKTCDQTPLKRLAYIYVTCISFNFVSPLNSCTCIIVNLVQPDPPLAMLRKCLVD